MRKIYTFPFANVTNVTKTIYYSTIPLNLREVNEDITLKDILTS